MQLASALHVCSPFTVASPIATSCILSVRNRLSLRTAHESAPQHLPPFLKMSDLLNNPVWGALCNMTYTNIIESRSNVGPKTFLVIIISCFVCLSFISLGFVLAFRRCSPSERDAQWSLFLMFVSSCTAASVFGVTSWSIAYEESDSLFNGLYYYAASEAIWCKYYTRYAALFVANRIMFGFEQVFILIAELLVVDRLLRVTQLSPALEKVRRLVWYVTLVLCAFVVLTRIVRGPGIIANSNELDCASYSISLQPNIIALFDFDPVFFRWWNFFGYLADGLMFSMVCCLLIVGVRVAYRDTSARTVPGSNGSEISAESATILSTMRKRVLFWIFFMILGTFTRALFSFVAMAGIKFSNTLAHDTECPVCDQSCLGSATVFVAWYRLNPYFFYSVVFLQELFPVFAALWCCSNDTLLKRFPLFGVAAPDSVVSRNSFDYARFNAFSQDSSGRSWISGVQPSVTAGQELLSNVSQRSQPLPSIASRQSQQSVAAKSETSLQDDDA